jgi:hypothetical protein
MRALLLQAFYSIRSERQLVERIDTDLLFRWFVGLGIENAVWDATTFTKNRDRLLEGAMASQFLTAMLSQDGVKKLLSSDHFSVDGTLLEAWASPKRLPSQRQLGRAAQPGAQRRTGLSRRAPDQRHACLDHRPRHPPLPQRAGQGGAAVFHRPRADGEPQRLDHRCGNDPRYRAMPSVWRRGR